MGRLRMGGDSPSTFSGAESWAITAGSNSWHIASAAGYRFESLA